MSSAAPIVADLSARNQNIVEVHRVPEMSTQTTSSAVALASGAGVTSATAVPSTGDLSSISLSSPNQSSAVIPHHTLEQHCRLLEVFPNIYKELAN